jgi:energy-converting hydrogenase Eha subunit A
MIKARHLSLTAIFAIPTALAALSLTGLVAALIGDGVWDLVGCLALGASAGVLVWALVARRHR